MKLKATLEAFYSARDVYGNCYWALRYTDHRTGRAVEGTVTAEAKHTARMQIKARGAD